MYIRKIKSDESGNIGPTRSSSAVNRGTSFVKEGYKKSSTISESSENEEEKYEEDSESFDEEESYDVDEESFEDSDIEIDEDSDIDIDNDYEDEEDGEDDEEDDSDNRKAVIGGIAFLVTPVIIILILVFFAYGKMSSPALIEQYTSLTNKVSSSKSNFEKKKQFIKEVEGYHKPAAKIRNELTTDEESTTETSTTETGTTEESTTEVNSTEGSTE